jgi:hypothetical protein
MTAHETGVSLLVVGVRAVCAKQGDEHEDKEGEVITVHKGWHKLRCDDDSLFEAAEVALVAPSAFANKPKDLLRYIQSNSWSFQNIASRESAPEDFRRELTHNTQHES